MKSIVLAASLGVSGVLVAFPANEVEKKILVLNKTGKPITAFYYAHPESNNWEDDAADITSVANDGRFEAVIDEDTEKCLYDFRIVFAGGEERITPNINVCERLSFTYRD